MIEEVGGDAVLNCIGVGESVSTAIKITRPRTTVGHAGTTHDVNYSMCDMFVCIVGAAGKIVPVRQYLPKLQDSLSDKQIDPESIFDLQRLFADGYRAMNKRRAIKSLLWVKR